MSESLGNGVSRTLSAKNRAFRGCVFQAFKPPLDSELNLVSGICNEDLTNLVRSQAHSGFFADPIRANNDFSTEPSFSNSFLFGDAPIGYDAPVLWANVNGWIIPVTGTAYSGIANKINLYPPPSSDTRIDFVFLEAWLTTIAPNPSTIDKPTASTIYKYGNVKFGGTNIPDDMQDPAMGFETTRRVQLQYRIRVYGSGTGLGASIDLSTYPDGLDSPAVKGQGTAASPVAAYTWTNMRDALGDPGLWRAGDGDANNDLGTVDGYTYAIPICAVFRRNTGTFVAQQVGGNANQNGAFNRNPYSLAISDPAEAVRVFTPVLITGNLSASGTGAIAVTGLANSGLDNADLYSGGSVFYTLDGEVIEVSAANASAGTMTIASRGRLGTQAAPHDAGTVWQFYCFRPDGLFADQIAPSDILDLRRSITLGEWDYSQLLLHNLGQLLNNRLRSSYKQSGVSDTEGTVIPEVATFPATSVSPVPNQTEQVDSPDGIREVFSDAVVVQHGIPVILKPEDAGGGAAPVQVPDFTSGAYTWGTAAGFQPSGWQPTNDGFQNGTVINLFIGGASGNDGARKSAGGARTVRFATPRELWVNGDVSAVGKRTPFTLRFLGASTAADDGLFCEPAAAGEPTAKHPGPMYPLPQLNFEYPFIVLGGIVQNLLRNTSVEVQDSSSTSTGYSEIRIPGLNFNASGDWFDASNLLDPTLVAYPVLYGKRTLYDMITKGGTDLSGASSELYLVLTGDTVNTGNCGVFRVIGAGNTTGLYSSAPGTAVNSLVVEGIQVGWPGFTDTSGLTAEARSQYTNTEDGPNASAGNAASAVVIMTDLEGTLGGAANPWRAAALAGNAMPFPTTSQAIIDTAVVYGPGRGSFARVPDALDRFAIVNPVSSTRLLRRAMGTLDPAANAAGAPTNEIYYPAQGIQTWAGLSDKGLSAPDGQSLSLGDGRGALSEQLREGELFADTGSKTLVVRPYRKVGLSLAMRDVSLDGGSTLIPSTYTLGPGAGNLVDDAGIFDATLQKGYGLPPEYMPHFGRHDIPVYRYAPTETTSGTIQALPFYYGVNHLFADSVTSADAVFNIIGGADNGGVAGVTPMLIQTGATSGLDYGQYGAILGGSAYQGRLYSDINIRSSDLPPGIKGIQLPPFLGIARIYGVYDRRDWTTGTGAWQADRVTPETGGTPPKNLIRSDVDTQTLFIVRGGASDVTGNAQDHTYMIPANLLDIRLSGSFVAGETFEDLEYVVECEVFGFARGFIDSNNYVLVRKHNGNGAAPSGIAQNVSMVLPLPLPANDCYAAYHRTVYQGDPFMTRGASVRTVSDYEPRFGQTPVASAYEIATAIQQYDDTGAQIPEIPNARSLQVLAAADFYTTLGTGKIGGSLQFGTVTDIGHLESVGTRLPTSATANQIQAHPRTFSQGQPDTAPRGQLTLRVLLLSASSAGQRVIISDTASGVAVTGISNASFSGASASTTAEALATWINANAYPRIDVKAYWNGGTEVLLEAINPGTTTIKVSLRAATGSRFVDGFALLAPTGYSPDSTSRYLIGGQDVPVNAARLPDASTPVTMAGLTERLPLGILANDYEFIGEDPARTGSSMLHVAPSAGHLAGNMRVPETHGSEYDRLNGITGHLGMADGGVLLYGAWTTLNPTGTRLFRVYRGASAYVLEGQNPGGPVDFTAGHLPDGAILKGAALAGRAYLVRNYEESAFGDVTSHGDEIQMVIVTRTVIGESLACRDGYALQGQISPTGYGDGYAAADRYRLEGKPLHSGASPIGPNPVVPLAPYPTDDPQPSTPC
jgi:hypothetical protein